MDCKYFNKLIKNIFIINGEAGKNRSKDFFQYLNNLPVECKDYMLMIHTDQQGDATKIAKVYSKLYPDAIIYSVGGDGTLNEVVNGIDCNSKLSIIPTGTGNDFYRIFKNIEGTKKIDLGIVNKKKFINIASLGMDAEIAKKANEYKRGKLFSKIAYEKAILDFFIQNPYYNTSLGDITLLVVANGKYYGNGVPINPNYNLNNGFFDVYYTERLRRLQMLKLLLKVFKEKHDKDKLVKYYQTDTIKIECKSTLACNIDGEIIYDKNFLFNVIPNGVTLTNEVPTYIKEYIKTRNL